MPDPIESKLAKWPFFVGDALLLGAAGWIGLQGGAGVGQLALAALCVAAAAMLGVAPFLLEYRVTSKLVEASVLTEAVSRIKEIETIAAQISGATGHWQEAQHHADKTAASAREIADRMSAELKGFAEFMERTNSREKATMQLELEKMRRAESEWLQVLIRMLDHVYALHVGAVRSSQPDVIDQVGNFQNACREVARRVGLAPFIARDAEPFDGQRHRLAEGDAQPAPGALIAETVAAGYTFQGRLLRPALVRVANGQGIGEQRSVIGNQ